MRVELVTSDTRGGIQPYVALAKGLIAAGHRARVVAPENFVAFIEREGVPAAGVAGDMQAALQSPEVKRAMEGGFWATHRVMIKHAVALTRRSTAEGLAACDGADLLLGGFGGMITGQAIAEKLGVPFVQAHLQPLTATAEFRGMLGGAPWRGRSVLNRWAHAIGKQVFWQPLRGAVNAARREVLGLPPAKFWGDVGEPGADGSPVLYGYSPSLLPRPSDWPAAAHVTGYWFLDRDANWSPPAGLEAFLDAGPPPLVAGFGSMSARSAEATTRLVIDAAKRLGKRVVLLAGWGGLSADELPDWAYLLDAAPHDWLFPRCAASIHHGGAGTTGAAVRAGIPSVIVPFGADQSFWAWCVAERGVGVSAGSRKSLTPARLARAIELALDPKIVATAAELGERVRAEDGVGNAVRLIEEFAEKSGVAKR